MYRKLFTGLLVFSGFLMLWWGIKLHNIHQTLLFAEVLNNQSITEVQKGDFEQAQKSLLALKEKSESIDRRSMNYVLVKKLFTDDHLPPVRTIQENIQDVEKLIGYDFYSQLIKMNETDHAALARGELPDFRYSYNEKIQQGGLAQAQIVYQQNKAEILQKRKENLSNIAVYHPVSGGASSFQSGSMEPNKTPSSLLSEVENRISGLLTQSNVQLSQKNAKKAYELAHEAGEYLISALASKKISGEEYLRLDEKTSKQKQKAINATS